MATARGDNTEGGSEREVRQQKLPLSWHAESVAPAPVPAADSAAASADTDAVQPAPASAAVVAPAGVQRLDPGPVDREPAAVAETAAPDSLGELLLRARADSGFSIAEASVRTRIPRDIIEHLECNAWAHLPSEYYCSAHVEKLGALYNVDAKPILERLHAGMLTQRGEADGLGQFRAVTSDSESGAKISYVLPGPGSGKPTRAVSLTSIVVSGVIALLLLIAVGALTVQHFRHREGSAPAGQVPAQVSHAPAVDLKEFIVTEELDAYELPIPAK
jgi:hypothetical protein